jgi:hypothetical protein
MRGEPLSPTGKLDERTTASWLENTGLSGSSTPPNSNRAVTNPHPESLQTDRLWLDGGAI